jgi:O-antigen biosynthesis protein
MNISTQKTNSTIIVVCWNALEYTKVTLKSLFNTIHHPFNLVIIDNHSADNTPKYLTLLKQPKWCVNLKVVLNKRNLGYGRAINIGYKAALANKSRYVCVCNNDLYFQDKWLEALEACLEKENNVGILGTLRPAVNYKHPSLPMSLKQVVDSTPNNLSAMNELKWFLNGLTFEEAVSRIIKTNGGGTELIHCPPGAIITCCAIVRIAVVRQLGHLADPMFKTYGSEDVDLSWSISKLGYQCKILKDIYVHHFRHKSISASHLNRKKYLQINNRVLFDKWSQPLYHFLTHEQAQGVDLGQMMNNETNHAYWILRRLNENVHFWDGQKLDIRKFK